MIEEIFNKLSPEMLLTGLILILLLFYFAKLNTVLCFSMGFPTFLFLGLLTPFFPISVSATSALFPLAALLGLKFNKSLIHFEVYEKLFVGLGILMTYSISYSEYPVYGRDKTMLFWFMVLPVIVLMPKVIRTTNALKTVIFVISSSLFFYVLLSFGVRLTMQNIVDRMAPLTEDVTVAGQFFGLASVFWLMRIIFLKDKRTKKVFWLVVLTMSIYLTLLTGTRAALLSFLLVMLFALWFSKFKLNKPVLLLSSVLLLILFLALSPIFFKNLLPEETINRFTTVDGFFSNFSSGNIRYWENSEARTINYLSAVQAFIAHPLTGVGAGGYKGVISSYQVSGAKLLSDESTPAYPHNMILEFGAEQGILGLVFILIILFLFFRMIFELRNSLRLFLDEKWLISLCASIFIYGFCLSMTALDIPRMMILWWGMGLLSSAYKIFTKQKIKNVKMAYSPPMIAEQSS